MEQVEKCYSYVYNSTSKTLPNRGVTLYLWECPSPLPSHGLPNVGLSPPIIVREGVKYEAKSDCIRTSMVPQARFILCAPPPPSIWKSYTYASKLQKSCNYSYNTI